MEFNRKIDSLINCDNTCWSTGGYQIIKDQCRSKIGNNENMCKAMEYYCDWSDSKGCTLNRDKTQNPWDEFPEYSENITTFIVRDDCGTNVNCIEKPVTDNNRYVIKSKLIIFVF